MSQPLFAKVWYCISETLPPSQRDQLSEVLDARGAKAVSVTDPKLTHFITASIALEDFVEALPEKSSAHVVTPRWVERSAVLGSLQDPEYYSADPAHLFSGITATATDLPETDCELMCAAISAFGGQWRTGLTRDVTHLFAMAPGSPKYDTAMHYKDKVDICVLVPHWFDDTIRLGIRDLPTKNYEWPEPRVFQQHPEGRTPQEDVDYEPPPERRMLYDTSSLSIDEQRKLKPAARNIWNGKRILLGLSLGLSAAHRKAIATDIRRQGGEVVELTSKLPSDAERIQDELVKLEEADIYITRYRTGPAYAKAYKLRLTIGTLAWLWLVRASGTLTRPADQLLHYPIPDTPADGFTKQVITVTNYTGKDREYLKKLITLMGGEFTASMSAERNTVVVAAYRHGTKTDKATSWSIPVVNHTWVEDCFVQWRYLTPANEKYTKFPPGVDFSVVLAERGIGSITWDPTQLEEMFCAAEAEAVTGGQASQPSTKRVSASTSPKKGGPKKTRRMMTSQANVPSGTAASAGEVEEAVAPDEAEVSLGEWMDVDANFADLEKGSPPEERMDVDDEAGPSKRPPLGKKGSPSKHTRREEEPPADAPAKRRLVRRFTPRNTDDEGEAVVAGTPKSKPSVRTYGSAKSGRVGAGSSVPSPSSISKPRDHPVVADEDVTMEGVSEVQERPKKVKVKKGPPGVRVTKETVNARPTEPKKRRPIDALLDSESDSSDEEDVRSVLGDLVKNGRASRTAGTRPAGSPSKPDETPQRLDSVLVPTVGSVYGSSAKKSGRSAAPKSTRGAASSAEVHAPAAEKPTRAPSPDESTHSPMPLPPKTSRKPKPATVEVPEAGPSRSTSPPKLTGRTPSRRSAATKATQKLHDVIMPDVISFQKEMKSGAVRAVHELEKAAAKGKARASDADEEEPAKTKGRGKKRLSSGDGDDAELDEEMPEKKRRKAGELEGPPAVAKGRKKATSHKSTTEPSEEPESQQSSGTQGKSLVAATTNGAARPKGGEVRVMTTQVTLTDDVVRALTRLGVKIVDKPQNCTHLLVKNVVRTEKFLCAMAVAPYVLNERWAKMSAAARRLLRMFLVTAYCLSLAHSRRDCAAEADYMIKDADTESKYAFTLTDALQRAKKNAGKLFAGKTFYVTPKVPVANKLLKNVVTANGGQLSTQTPTVRMLNGHDDRFVISCTEDISIWRPLVEHGHQIYTQELILTSALRQELNLDHTEHQVPGSFRG
ncbi:hypothetical protein C8Q78DRAFT_480053 [Trametes maxima]|nr:hypothetical protein C8Q78DRAFT_480053 [Trametes maxima]